METSFLQSEAWQEFQEKFGHHCFRWHDYLLIQLKLPGGKSFLYCPRVNLKSLDLNQLLEALKSSAKRPDLFIRFEPLNQIKIPGSFPAPATQPKVTTFLNLQLNQDQLLTKMKAKTRYNLSLAEKKGVKVNFKLKPATAEFNQFWALISQTSQRDHFSLHPKRYYEQMFQTLGEKEMVYLGTAQKEKKLLAAMILIIFQNQAVYLHGASSYQDRAMMAPYLLHWQAIKFAQSQNCQTYDFWGLKLAKDQDLTQTQELEGVTRFKLGFGGEILYYPNSWEFPFKKLEYYGYRAARSISRLIKPRTFE